MGGGGGCSYLALARQGGVNGGVEEGREGGVNGRVEEGGEGE